jgi:hypothetical protein
MTLDSVLRSAWGPVLWPMVSFFFLVAIEAMVRMHKFVAREIGTEERRGHQFDLGVVSSRIVLIGLSVMASCCIASYLADPESVHLVSVIVLFFLALCLPFIRFLECEALAEEYKRYWPRNRAGLLGIWIPLPCAILLTAFSVWAALSL